VIGAPPNPASSPTAARERLRMSVNGYGRAAVAEAEALGFAKQIIDSRGL